ncbi:hypothetical protein EON65_53935, partial [archaeon]
MGLLSYVRGRAKGGKRSAVPFGKNVKGGVSVGGGGSKPPSSALSKISEVGEGEGGAGGPSVGVSLPLVYC